MSSQGISIIIPVLNEEKQIGNTIRRLYSLQSGSVKEIVVVDGGSDDGTVLEAELAGATVVRAEKGRAKQMNTGAREAKGDVLYFLHADTEPPKLFDREISTAIKKGYGFGCFQLEFDWDHSLLRFYSWFTRFRNTGIRFGDQSLFVKRTVFERSGGFDESLIVMEDQEIYRRLHNFGEFYLSNRSVITSARKYKESGPIKLQILFTLIWLGYYFGVKQKALVKLYKRFIHLK